MVFKKRRRDVRFIEFLLFDKPSCLFQACKSGPRFVNPAQGRKDACRQGRPDIIFYYNDARLTHIDSLRE